MDACRYGSGCWRPLCPYGHSGGRAARWAALWALLENQEYGSEDERTVERTIDEPPKVNLAESSGEAGSSWSGAHDTTSPAPPISRRTVPRQNPNSQNILMKAKLGPPGPELTTRPASQSLVVKRGLLSSRSTVPQQNPISQSIPLKVPHMARPFVTCGDMFRYVGNPRIESLSRRLR